jgi:hypothetical protein
MKPQLIILLLIVAAAFYESYLKGPAQLLFGYAKTAVAAVTIVYLLYSFYRSPDEFYVALDFVKDYFSRSDGGMAKQIDRLIDGKPKFGRQVSPLLKKKVAADQEWRCGDCKAILDASYEVDHTVPLFKGGSNDAQNLVALCRNCHGKKTVADRLKPY